MLKKKISKILIGTNNKGKLREIKDLLPKSIKIFSTSDFNLKSPAENGLTFKENSIIKSKYFSKKSNLVCIADDSGLEIDCLDKKPGIFSARWAGSKGNFNKVVDKNPETKSFVLSKVPTKRLEKSIALYMPPSVSVDYNIKYGEQEIGAVAMASQQLIDAVAADGATFDTFVEWLSKTGKENFSFSSSFIR